MVGSSPLGPLETWRRRYAISATPSRIPPVNPRPVVTPAAGRKTLTTPAIATMPRPPMPETRMPLMLMSTRRSDGVMFPSRKATPSSIRPCRSDVEKRGVTDNVGLRARRQVGEFSVRAQRPLTQEAAFLEHVVGGAMVGVAERVETLDAEVPRQLAHRAQRLRGIAVSPRVAREHVAGRGLLRR